MTARGAINLLNFFVDLLTIQFNGEILCSLPSTEPFLSNIRELSNIILEKDFLCIVEHVVLTGQDMAKLGKTKWGDRE